MDGPLFIEPPALEKPIDPKLQEVYDDCGTCRDCQNHLERGLVAVRRDIQPLTLEELGEALNKNDRSVRSRKIYQGDI